MMDGEVKVEAVKVVIPVYNDVWMDNDGSKSDTKKLGLTGNPFVDSGLGVISSLVGLDKVSELSLDHLKSVYSDGSQLAYWNSKLPSFTQIFGTNNPLYQHAYGYKKGKGSSEDNIAIYKSTLKGFLNEVGESKTGQRCWACGTPSDIDFEKICKKAVEESISPLFEINVDEKDVTSLDNLTVSENLRRTFKEKRKVNLGKKVKLERLERKNKWKIEDNQYIYIIKRDEEKLKVIRIRKEEKNVGRDWFPLAGSIGSDAQNLPAASITPHICPKCLFAVHYLPLGLMLLDGRLAVFQSTSIDFWYEFVKNLVNEVKTRVHAGNYATLGRGEGSSVLAGKMLIWFDKLQKAKKWDGIPIGTNLYVWRFSNSGQNPDCQIEEIPNPALVFLWEATLNGLKNELLLLIGSERKNRYNSLFRCILEGRDYLNLYPEGKKKGASPKLFALYQTNILNRSVRTLQVAYILAKEVSKDAKELRRLQRQEAFQEKRVRNQFKLAMVRMAERGELTLKDYLALFPPKESQGITVGWDGWNIIRFYLHHAEDEDEPIVKGTTCIEPEVSKGMLYYSAKIYSQYVKEKGKERFQREVLQQMGRGKIDVKWLRRQFVLLAEEYEGFTYGDWSQFCKLENGRLFVSELLFQMRLLWTQWLHNDNVPIDLSLSPLSDTYNELPNRIQTLINHFFQDYVNRRGIERFYRDILSRLRKREIGLFWFKEHLTKQVFEDVSPITEEEWEGFLVDDEGQSIKTERLFQLHLALANLYRKGI